MITVFNRISQFILAALVAVLGMLVYREYKSFMSEDLHLGD